MIKGRQNRMKGSGQDRVVSLAQQLEQRLAQRRQELADVDRQIADLVGKMQKGNGTDLVEQFLPLKGRRDLLQASVNQLAEQFEVSYVPDLRERVAAAKAEEAQYRREVRDPVARCYYQELKGRDQQARGQLTRSNLSREQKRQIEIEIAEIHLELIKAAHKLEDVDRQASTLARAHQKLRDELSRAEALLQEAKRPDPATEGAPVQGALQLAPI